MQLKFVVRYMHTFNLDNIIFKWILWQQGINYNIITLKFNG